MIWCVEDDASIRDIELYALRAAGLEVVEIREENGWECILCRHPRA